MTLYDTMTDAELDQAIDGLAREIAEHEAWFDSEYQHDDEQREFQQAFIGSVLRESIASWERAMAEKRRRMGYWICP